ncbi:hypothetical protein CSQ93_10255 [Janthinobacterium sp. BJB426]|uniref:hypothetical protein n=1 Tax=Janthinobacterium sp. BJB426 TaxID=2048010 RepID=UPI000C0C8382|nr:hypothetical protein [Janthinobacterium sp. BJB426]PHV27952.1 hypothetical protein CSQ93_10255 [Janthinobacterium sp. BJB426]
MKHTDTIALQGSIADMRQRIAAEQAAMHKVRLGVARWSNAPAPQDADAPPSPASQTHWHAEAQCQFMCWLELGGFAHADAETDTTSAPPPDTSAIASDGASMSINAAAARQSSHCNGCAV